MVNRPLKARGFFGASAIGPPLLRKAPTGTFKGFVMAANETGEDLGAHVRDYSRFTGLMKWGTIVSLIVTAFVIVIIAN